MLRFQYMFSGEASMGFARKFKKDGFDRYLVVLTEGIRLTVQFNPQETGGDSQWKQILKPNEIKLTTELIKAVGLGLQKAEIIY